MFEKQFLRLDSFVLFWIYFCSHAFGNGFMYKNPGEHLRRHNADIHV